MMTTALQNFQPSSSTSSRSQPSSSLDLANTLQRINVAIPWAPPRGRRPFGNPKLEEQLLTAIRERSSRSSSSTRAASREDDDDDKATFIIEGLIDALERTPSIPEPAIAPQLYGRWRLQYTTTKATSSPIQRTATTRTQNLSIFQDIVVVEDKDDNDNDENKDNRQKKNPRNRRQRGRLLVKQIIQFSDRAYLTVDALASTKAYPLEELTMQSPRQSTGRILGLNLLGVSKVGADAAEDPRRPNARINFVFDEGYLDVNHGRPIRIPYPVPFRWPIFRDWVKGWIDVTYLSDTMRIARGNKGSTFVLVKE